MLTGCRQDRNGVVVVVVEVVVVVVVVVVVPPDDVQYACLKHAEVNYWSKLKENSAY